MSWEVPTNGIAEIAAMDSRVLEEFSKRTTQTEDRLAEKLERFFDAFGRGPTPRERWRLGREAATDSRPAKATVADASDLHATWCEQVRALGREPEAVIAEAMEHPPPPRTLGDLDPNAVVDAALAALAQRQSSWRPAELVRELAAAVPTQVRAEAAELVEWVEELSQETTRDRLVELSRPIPPGVALRRDGRPIGESVLDRALTTPAILAEEERLLSWAAARVAHGGHDAPVPVAENLSGPQRELATAVAGDRPLVLAVGPAGTSKTVALAPAVVSLRTQGRVVFGVAPSATAAEVLGQGAGVEADTLDKLLVEHRLARPPGSRYDLPPGATVIVDEAAMVPTPDLLRLAELATSRRWRLALVGDPLQFSAVGRSGMFGLLAETTGAIELDRVRRFANDWERAASLRPRRGDVSVLGVYYTHGRIHGGPAVQMERAVVQSWWLSHGAGEAVSMMAPTNEAVVRLNRRAQALRMGDGGLDTGGPSLRAGPYEIHVGDVVATRRNDRSLRTDRGLMVRNRDRWEVRGIAGDGSLSLHGRSGSVVVPAAYVADHVELAYAETSHANQGRTVDRSLLFLDTPTDTRGVYVPLTRGRVDNHAFVVLEDERSAADVLGEALSRDWIDEPAIVRRAQLQEPSTHPSVIRHHPLGPVVLRKLLEQEFELRRTLESLDDRLRLAQSQLARAQRRRDALAAEVAEKRERYEQALEAVEHRGVLRRTLRPGRAESAARALKEREESLAGREGALAAAEARLPGYRQQAEAAGRAKGNRARLENDLSGVRLRLERDATTRAASLAEDAPDHLVGHLGPRPSRPEGAAAWDDAAVAVGRHLSMYGMPGDGEYWLGLDPDDDYGLEAESIRKARIAAQRLDVVMGRAPQIEPSGLELSM